jgi:polygalacturonase
MANSTRIVLCCLSWAAVVGQAAGLDALMAGADPTGARLCTAEIQKAIDEVAATGGGEVTLPKGTYQVTALRLKSGVTLRLDEGAVLRPSRNSKDYGEEKWPTVGAEGATNVAVVGKGVVEGGGDCFYETNGVAMKVPRPHYVLHFKRCKGVRVEDATLKYSMHWTCRLDCCEDIVVRRVTIRNRCFSAQNCTDGIDLVSCRRALIEKCDIETGDDGICLKSELGKSVPTDQHPVMTDITVRDCVIATTCNATKIGTETVGDIENVLFERITVRKHAVAVGKNPTPSGVCIAAISLQSNDGAKIRNLTFRDYTIEDCYAPVFIQLQDRDSHRESDLGSLGGITIERLTCTRARAASQINVSVGGRLGAITLADFDVRTQEAVAEKPGTPKRPTGKYPDAKNNGVMPAYGLFARDVDGLTLRGKMLFKDEANSGRAPIILEGVDGLDESGVSAR